MAFSGMDIEDLLARLREQYDRMGITALREAADCITQLRDQLAEEQEPANEQYNGWTNRATWNLALWADNDWTDEFERWRGDERINSGDKLQEAWEQCIAELELHSYMLQPLKGCEPSVFLTPDGERFSDADWDELYEYLIDEPRKEAAAAQDE